MNRSCLAMIASDFDDGQFPIVTTEQFQQLIKDPNVRIVDARLPSSYQRAHVPGAINIPVIIDFGGLREKVTSISADHHVVVYCQSADCVWADAIARKLPLWGIRDVSIYREGFEGWESANSQTP